MRCGKYGIQFPTLRNHQRVRSDVLHDLGGDLARVADARALLLVAEQDDIVGLDQSVQLSTLQQLLQELEFLLGVQLALDARGRVGVDGLGPDLAHHVEQVSDGRVRGPRLLPGRRQGVHDGGGYGVGRGRRGRRLHYDRWVLAGIGGQCVLGLGLLIYRDLNVLLLYWLLLLLLLLLLLGW